MAGVILINIAVVILITLFVLTADSYYWKTEKLIAWLALSIGATFWIWVIYVIIHFLQKFW